MKISIIELEFTPDDDLNTLLNVLSVLKNGDTCRPVRRDVEQPVRPSALPRLVEDYRPVPLDYVPHTASLTRKLIEAPEADNVDLPLFVSIILGIVFTSPVWIAYMLLFG